MANTLLLSLSTLAALVPATLLPYRRVRQSRDLAFWAVLAVALAGPAAYALAQFAGGWRTDLATALWVSIAATMVLFIVLVLTAKTAWRLMPLLLPYLLALGLLATVWGSVPAHRGLVGPPDAWLAVHIAVSVATYALCTLAAVAAAAVFLQERALKRKAPNALSRRLPSVADASRLQVRLLAISEGVLALGIVTGMAKQYLETGALLEFDHKTLLVLLAFAVIGGLLILHHRTGLRGQRAARVLLLGYLLLTLAYPGVKFVTDVLIG